MAFQDVSNGNSINPGKELEVGASLTGYVLGFVEGKHGKNIVMRDAETGEETTVYSSGNIKYAVRDGKIKIGLLTRITRKPNEKVKGMESSKFSIEQDPEDTIETSSFNSVFEGQEETTSASSSSTAVALTKGIKAQTERLAKAAAGGRK